MLTKSIEQDQVELIPNYEPAVLAKRKFEKKSINFIHANRNSLSQINQGSIMTNLLRQ